MSFEAHSALFLFPKVPYEYQMDRDKVHFKTPSMTDGVATFMIFMTWAEDVNKNRIIHFQFVPVVCEECFKK